MNKIFVFGNEDLEMDSLPLRILPELKKELSDLEFEEKDPNEEWDLGDENEEEVWVIDAVVGIKEVTIFDDLEKFSKAPNVSMHDFDALANLRLLQKLGKIKNVKVIGLPSGMSEEEAVKKISAALRGARSERTN